MPRLAARELLERLKPDFTVEVKPGSLFAVRTDEREALARAGFGPEAREALTASELRGRHPLGELAVGEERLLVRRFSHGGLLRFLTGERFLDPTRPFRELLLAQRLLAAGIATADYVAARAVRHGRGGWRLALVFRRIREAEDLGAVLARRDRGELGFARRAGLVRATGSLLGRLHEIGFVHADLHPKNVLVGPSIREEPPPLWLLDLDRSRFEAPLAEAVRRANLGRFVRWLVRERERGRAAWSRGDVARFFQAYASALEPAAVPGSPVRTQAPWRVEFEACRRLLGRSLVAHRLGWWLEGRLGRTVDR